MIVSGSFAVIPKKEYPFMEPLIQKHLILDEGETVSFFYEEHPDYWIVPRYFPEYAKKVYSLKYDIEYQTIEPIIVEYTTSIEPRDSYQKQAIKILSNTSERFTILQARPGFGKTICTIKALQLMSQKALIVVHREKLANQWKEKILQFTNLTEDDVPIFAGHLNKDQLNNMKIGIAIIHTLANRYLKRDITYHQLMKNVGIGVIVFDECHACIPTEFYQKGQGLLYANRYIGLSATPFRNSDPKTHIIYFNVGDNIHIVGSYDLKPKVYELHFKSNIPERTKRWIIWDNKFILQRYLKKVVETPIYRQLVINLIKNAVEDDRYILILAPRKETLKILGELTKEQLGIDVGYFWAGQPKSVLQKKRVIFATSQIFTEGLDIPRLDTLIVLDQFADKTKLEQMIGRILRHHDEKKQPKVVFFVDEDFELQKWLSNKRKKIYNSLGFEFEDIRV